MTASSSATGREAVITRVFEAPPRAGGFHSEPRSLGRPLRWEEVLADTEAMDFDEDQLREMAGNLRDVVEHEAEEGVSPYERQWPSFDDDEFARLREIRQLVADEFGAALALIPVAPWGTRGR